MQALDFYKSHKIVQAAKILEVNKREFKITVVARDNTTTVVEVPSNYFGRGEPSVGDYFVLYDDVYMSYSPADTFQAGYTIKESE